MKAGVFFLLLISLINSIIARPATARSLYAPVEITAAVGEPRLTVFGYSSPGSQIELQGQAVSQMTTADGTTGYFLFDRLYLPEIYLSYSPPATPELCLSAIDLFNRVSFPVCLPPIPPLNQPAGITVGPVILSPTLTLEENSDKKPIFASGLTLPEAEVRIFLANDPSPSFFSLFSRILVSPAEAYFLPVYELKSDEHGYFEFSLPEGQSAKWQIFASALYQNHPSPKSQTLTFVSLSPEQWRWLRLAGLIAPVIGFLKSHLWPLTVLAELTAIGLIWGWNRRKSRPQDQWLSNFPKKSD